MGKLLLPPKGPGGANEEWDVKSVVIVGANGSGKSRIGAWIEQNPGTAAVHRISAQRALTMPDIVTPRPYEQAKSQLHYGQYVPAWSEERYKSNKVALRWGDDPVGHMLSDYDALLATLFADESKRNLEYTRAALTNAPSTTAPECNLDVLERVWKLVFPYRELVVGQDKIAAKVPNGGQYAGSMMSDGERVAFYLIGQALSAPSDATVVIDEPEIHLHRAIQATLWDQIESRRSDCVFVYITHDLDFAGSRSGARKIWMKSFDGGRWEWDELEPHPELPEELLLHVLGSRRPVLFVEGDQNSHDAALYRALYPDRTVVPLSNCDRVIEADKAVRQLAAFHRLDTSGLVDRDHRSNDEIASLRSRGLRVADVAEVENVFCIPLALEAAAAQLKRTDVKEVVEAAKQRVFAEMKRGIEAQIAARAIAEIRFRLGGFGPRAGDADATTIEAEVARHVSSIDVQVTFKQSRDLFEGIAARADYDAALRYYNCKGIPSFVAGVFGMKEQAYCTMIVGILQSDPTSALANEMRRKIS